MSAIPAKINLSSTRKSIAKATPRTSMKRQNQRRLGVRFTCNREASGAPVALACHPPIAGTVQRMPQVRSRAGLQRAQDMGLSWTFPDHTPVTGHKRLAGAGVHAECLVRRP
jgi:hypothetical protein